MQSSSIQNSGYLIENSIDPLLNQDQWQGVFHIHQDRMTYSSQVSTDLVSVSCLWISGCKCVSNKYFLGMDRCERGFS